VRGDPDDLLGAIRRARSGLPVKHRGLLDAIGVQEGLIERWPDGVLDLYETLREHVPPRSSLDGAAAAWLHGLRTVVFNAGFLRHAVHGLNEPTTRIVIANIAWHEYGHALSVVRAGAEQRERGLQLMDLLPQGLREAIDFPDRYRSSQVFDEVMATLYALMIGRVPSSGYSPPDFLHPDLFAAFQEVFPWPPTP
jgi:phage tail protein X